MKIKHHGAHKRQNILRNSKNEISTVYERCYILDKSTEIFFITNNIIYFFTSNPFSNSGGTASLISSNDNFDLHAISKSEYSPSLKLSTHACAS